MKKAILTVILIALLIATTPFISLGINHDKNSYSKNPALQSSATVPSSTVKQNEKNTDISNAKQKNISTTEATNVIEKNNNLNENNFRIYDKATNEIIVVSDFNFCCGALATEIETDIPVETIKAQAVAIHTYYSYLRETNRAKKTKYDFECNSKIWETYVSKDELKEKWGETFEESYKIISDAVKTVENTFILYDDKPCMAKYFKISSGNTDSYKEIYEEDIPYLTNVPSPFDTVANNYKIKTEYTKEEFDTAVKKNFTSYKSTTDINNNISDISKNANGTVLNIKIGNTKTTGKELANALNLRSSCFEVSCSDTGYTFTTYGHGENIGMSQFGACILAKQGCNYIEILQYYYPNTTISTNYNLT